MKPAITQIKITNRYPADWLDIHGITEVMLLSYVDASEKHGIGDDHEDWGYEGQTIEVFGLDKDNEQIDMPKTAPLYPRTKLIDGDKIDGLDVVDKMGQDSWKSEWVHFPFTDAEVEMKQNDPDVEIEDEIEDLITVLMGDYQGND